MGTHGARPTAAPAARASQSILKCLLLIGSRAPVGHVTMVEVGTVWLLH